jgi:hypothetical protein
VRLHHALFVLLFTISLTAQEDPLPVVTARNTAPEVMLIATAVEPIREFRGPTLAEAARANDFISFDALYREARQRGESVAAFEPLHELWLYSVTDPIGAFYGADLYAKLARAYPGYRQFIEEYSIVDSLGNVFYPTAETREFLLARALEGRSVPRVLVASSAAGTDDAPAIAPEHTAAAARGARRSPATSHATAKPAAAVKTTPLAAVKTTPVAAAPVRTERVGVAPVKVAAAPAAAAEAAPIVAAPPVVTPRVVAEQPAVEAPPAIADDLPEATAPIQAVQAPPVQAQPAPQSSPASRGLVLIVIGLLGIGLLAVMFRAPKETLPSTIAQPPAAKPADDKPVAPVEPLKRPEGPQRVSGKNRANGSRG